MIWSKFVIGFMVVLLFVSCSETEKVDDPQQHQVESKNLINVDELLDVYNDTLKHSHFDVCCVSFIYV